MSNRFGHDDLARYVGQVEDRIPMVTLDEQRQLQRENAEAEARHWSAVAELNSDTAVERMALSDKARAAAEASLKLCDDLDARAEAAKDRLVTIEHGEDVSGGLSKPVEFEQFLLKAGWTNAAIRNAKHLDALMRELEKRGIAGDFWEALHKRREASDRPIQRAAERDVLRKHGLQWITGPVTR